MKPSSNYFTKKIFLQAKGQRGMVLVLVLMVFALAAVIAGELSYDSHREVRRTANILHTSESYLFARAGEVFAIQKLLEDYNNDQQSNLKADYLTELWSTECEAYNVDSATNNDPSLQTGDFVQDEFLQQENASAALQDIGELVVIIEDLQARFNLNNVQYNNPGHKTGVNQLNDVVDAVIAAGEQSPQFAQQVGAEPVLEVEESINEWPIPVPDLVSALQNWIDKDDSSQTSSGAEDDFYNQKTPAYQAANQNMVDVSELMAIQGFDQGDNEFYQFLFPNRLEEVQDKSVTDENDELTEEQNNLDKNASLYDANGNLIPELPCADERWGGIEHYFSALPFPTKINVNTASTPVLRTLFTSEQAEKIITNRESNHYESIEDAFLIADIQSIDKAKYTPYLSVNSEYFLVTSIATIGETKFTLSSKLHRNGKGEVRVLSRDFSF